jgi:hypothetical protein
MKNLKEKIRDILDKYPLTRNSDIGLMIALWKIHFPKYIKVGGGGRQGIWLEDLFNLPREDHIKRIRAMFQNDKGLYLPSDPAVRKQRKISEEKWLDFVRVNTEYKRI